MKKALKLRDFSDINRKHSPLRVLKDSIVIDTSKLTKKEVLHKVSKIVDRKLLLKYGSKFNDPKNDRYLCSSHPHQIYFDFLAEHGFIGSIIILSIFFKLIFDLLRKISINRNKLQFASFIYILIVFMPILPSGAFFSDYLLTLFFINFSLLFCVDKKSNLFYKNN